MSRSKIANQVAGRFMRAAEAEERDKALELTEESVDAIIASLTSLDETVGQIRADNVAQKAALDAIKETLETAIKPYMVDIVKALQAFDK